MLEFKFGYTVSLREANVSMSKANVVAKDLRKQQVVRERDVIDEEMDLCVEEEEEERMVGGGVYE